MRYRIYNLRDDVLGETSDPGFARRMADWFASRGETVTIGTIVVRHPEAIAPSFDLRALLTPLIG